MDIIITLPQTIRWEDYQRELDAVVNFDNELLFKVPFLIPVTKRHPQAQRVVNNYSLVS